MDLVTALRLEEDERSPVVISLTGAGGKTSTMHRLADELSARGVRVVCTATTRLAAYQVEATESVVMMAGAVLPHIEIARMLDRHGQCLLVRPEMAEDDVQKYPGVPRQLVDELVNQSDRLGFGAVIVEADGSKMLPLKAPAAHEPPVPVTTTIMAPVVGLDALGRRIDETQVHRPERVRDVLGLAADAEVRVTPERIARLLLDPLGGHKGLPARARFLPILNKAEAMPERAGARIAARIMAGNGVSSLVASTGCVQCEPVHERWGPTAAVVLAAGAGRRFGEPKQLVEVDGEPLAVRAVKTMLESGVERVIVVTGAYADETVNCVKARFGDGLPHVRFVHNATWWTGQAGSMHAALHALGEEMQAVIFLPVDQPFVPAALLRRLLQLWREGCGLAAPQVDGHIRGAPGLFDRAYWPELLQVRGDKGGRDVLRKYASQVGVVDVDGRVLVDVDTPSDLAGVG